MEPYDLPVEATPTHLHGYNDVLEPAKRAAQAFRSPSDDMQRATVHLPRATVRALKQAALDRDTSMSKILTDVAEHWLKTQQWRNALTHKRHYVDTLIR